MADYKPRAPSIRVAMKSDPDLWVEIKGDLRWREYKHIITAKGQGEGEFLDSIARHFMLAWNLQRDGKPLPLDPDELSKDDLAEVLDKALDIVNAVTEEADPNGSRL